MSMNKIWKKRNMLKSGIRIITTAWDHNEQNPVFYAFLPNKHESLRISFFACLEQNKIQGQFEF